MDAATEALILETVPASLTELNSRLAAGDWSDIPKIELLSGSAMGGAIGAWAESTQTIYLNSDWLSTASSSQVEAVLTEEFGHYLDSTFKTIDTQGDEGELFSRILRGEELSADEVQAIGSDNDAVVVTLGDGTEIKAEAATLTGSESNDTITGSNSADTINGRDGDDIIDGRAGNDTILGGGGNDIISGGDGDDSIDAGPGDNRIYGGAGNDWIDASNGKNLDGNYYAIINEDNLHAQRYQYIEGNDGDDSIAGYSISSEVNAGSGNDQFYGMAKTITMGLGDDVVYFSDKPKESTSIDGGEGFDTLILRSAGLEPSLQTDNFGDLGNITGFEKISPDIYYFVAYASLVIGDLNILTNLDRSIIIDREENSAEIGIFEVFAENISQGSVSMYGSNEIEILHGGSTGDKFWGNGGSDIFDGNSGNDFFDGGDGVDTAIFSGNSSDYTITEITYNTFEVKDNRIDSPDGTDTIIDVNKLRFADGEQDVVIAGLNIVGDDSAEEIDGGSNADYIDGAGGNDTVNGEGGNDDLAGGSGNDTVNGGIGNDLIDGDLGNDTLVGGDGNDVVDAGEGDDLIVGGNGRGDDLYTGGIGLDTVRYTSALAAITVNLATGTARSTAGGDAAGIGTDTLSGIENVIAGSFNDTLIGDAQNNRLNGWLGADSMNGGGGNDTYDVDNTGDVVTEGLNAGTDTVQSSIAYTLGANVENLVLTGTGVINGTGNTQNNSLTGNAANNVLNGSTGADTMAGGLGNDTYIVDNTSDVVSEGLNAGTDTVQSSVTYTLGANLENLILTGTAAINGTGNTQNNSLTGNAANNILNADVGADSINGGGGNDTLIGGAGRDVMTGSTGVDKFVYSSVADSGVGSAVRDVITDFQGGSAEKIDLSAIDAYTNTTGNQAFTYIGSNAFTGSKGEVRFSGGVLQLNTGTDKIADMEIALTGVTTFSSTFLIL